MRENNATPPQIAVIDAVTKPVRTIVDLNPGFSLLQKGATERLEGTNSYGENWFAYLVKPLDFVPGTKYPLIVTTYRSGDYFLRGASGDENPIQVYAAHGFAVLCVDVGWTRNRVTGDFDETLLNWASPTASIDQAVRRLAQEGIIDLARVGIAGFSHGEEIAGYAVIHSDLFHAAVGAQNYDPFFYFLGSDRLARHFRAMGSQRMAARRDQPDMAKNCDVHERRQNRNSDLREYFRYRISRHPLNVSFTEGRRQADRTIHLPKRIACAQPARTSAGNLRPKSRLVSFLAERRTRSRSKKGGAVQAMESTSRRSDPKPA